MGGAIAALRRIGAPPSFSPPLRLRAAACASLPRAANSLAAALNIPLTALAIVRFLLCRLESPSSRLVSFALSFPARVFAITEITFVFVLLLASVLLKDFPIARRFVLVFGCPPGAGLSQFLFGFRG
jgi:hypothetical protein